MENLLIITFPDAENALEGLNRLKDLDQLGDINIYNMAMIRKRDNQQFDLLHQEGPDLGVQPAAGAIGGTLIGAIGGPVGMTIGMITGLAIGSVGETDSLDFSDKVLDKVKNTLRVGDYAIVLDLEEDNEFIVNSYMEPYRGVITRTDIVSQYDAYDQEQWNELNKEIDDEEQSLKTAIDKDKAAIKVKLDKLKKQRDEKLEKMKARSAKRKKHLEDKIKSFDEKIKTAGEKAKVKLNAHRKELKDKLAAIDAKLDWAFA